MDREPSQVWMVNRRTGPVGMKGWLFLEEERLLFRPDDERAADVAFPLEKIKSARRVHGSPVLELALAQPHEFRVLGFYFIKPPSLEREDAGGLVFKKRAARKQSVVRLRTWNAVKKEDVADWVKAIGTARRQRARG
jgi:hypothetical protein